MRVKAHGAPSGSNYKKIIRDHPFPFKYFVSARSYRSYRAFHLLDEERGWVCGCFVYNVELAVDRSYYETVRDSMVEL
jgi:hypothetical protein